MPRKLTLKMLILLNLIQLWTSYTQAQGDSTYTLPLWQARELVRDAVVKHIQDSIIDSLESKIHVLETNSVNRENQFRSLLKIESERAVKNAELTQVEKSMKEFYKDQARKYNRQRNWAIGIAVAAPAYAVFKPP